MNCDVLVVGAGLAGFTAALTAAESGADVLLIEKCDEVGGSTVLSGGSFAFAGTDLQQRAGIEDSGEQLFEDLMEVGQQQNDPELVGRYVQDNLAAYEWLCARGVQFGPVQAASGQSVPRSHPTDPRHVIELLHGAANRVPNLRLVAGFTAERLVQDAESGAVTGLRGRDEGGDVLVRAERGVVLTSGGFCQNAEMIAAFAPGKERAIRVGGAGNYGDGIRMAWKLGAGLRDMPYVKGTFGNHPDAKPHEHTACMAVYKGAIAVNKQGQRFVDESRSYKLLGDACLEQEDALAFQIFDEYVLDQETPGYRMFDFRPRLAEGRLLTADTLPELAEKIGVPAAKLLETVDAYNSAIERGVEDKYGRKYLTHHYGELVPIQKPPFYAYPSTSAVIATYAGITTNPNAQVVDVFGAVIPGLYAAGELMGGFHGASYMTGTSLGKATVFGRIAGAQAVQNAGQRKVETT